MNIARRAPRVSVVVVNWNTKEALAEGVRSLRHVSETSEYEVIVVDNASSDGSAAMVREHFPWVRLVQNNRNRGFGGGVNDGLAIATGEYLVIVNPDIHVPNEGINEITRILSQDPKIGAASPLLVDRNGEVQTGYFRRTPTVMQVLLFYTSLQPLTKHFPLLVEKYLEEQWTEHEGVADVEQLPGACIVTSRRVMDTVGGFDERFPLFFEDVDWSKRVRNHGFRLVLVPAVRAEHEGGGSFKADRGWLFPLFRGSMALYFRKHCSRPGSLAVDFILIINSIFGVVKKSLEAVFRDGAAREEALIARRQHGRFLCEWAFSRRTVPGKGLPQ